MPPVPGVLYLELMDIATATAARTGTVYVIPCGAAKLDTPAPARDLYTGAMFRHTLTAALATAEPGDTILILSALHGLVELETVLDPYNCKMGDPGSVTAGRLTEQADALGIGWQDDVYGMLPKAYYTVLDAALRPLGVYLQDVYEGTGGIGEQRGVNRCVTQFA